MFEEIKGKKILFISTKNTDYIRNTQEINLLQQISGEVDVLSYLDRSYCMRLIKIYCALLFRSLKDYDVIFVGFAPQLILPFWGWKIRNKNIYIDFFISVYDTLAHDRKKIRPESLAANLCKQIDRKTLKKADHVIVDTAAHGSFFCQELELDRSKMTVLYLEADSGIYFPKRLPKPVEYAGKYVVLYFGSILPLQGIDVIMSAIKLLQEKKDILFEIIGPVKGKQKLNNVVYYDWLSQEELSDHIAVADLCLAGHFNAEIKKASRTIPGKAYIYEAMGKSMILGDNSANRELFQEDEEHIYVGMGDPYKLAEVILAQKEKSKLCV